MLWLTFELRTMNASKNVILNKIFDFQAGGSSLGIGGPTVPLRPRIKRVNLRDMIFYLEQERDTCRSTMLYKSYLK